jgi:hypothetical protein
MTEETNLCSPYLYDFESFHLLSKTLESIKYAAVVVVEF